MPPIIHSLFKANKSLKHEQEEPAWLQSAQNAQNSERAGEASATSALQGILYTKALSRLSRARFRMCAWRSICNVSALGDLLFKGTVEYYFKAL
jgi:hypothetical protein